MAVDLEALKASLVDRAIMAAVTKGDWATQDEATQDASVVATTTVWDLIDDLEAANALYDRVSRLIPDPRLQPYRDPRAGVTRLNETGFPAYGSDVWGPLET